MAKLTHEEWREWINLPVTLELNQAVKDRIQGLLEILSNPDSDRDRDMYLRGMIRAFREVLEAKPELLDEDLFEDTVEENYEVQI